MQKRVILKIYGQVQGVFFRAFAQKKAKELNLLGSAKNEPDGTVKIVAEGEKEDLETLIKWCQKDGPENAVVEKVDIEWQEKTGGFSDFSIN